MHFVYQPQLLSELGACADKFMRPYYQLFDELIFEAQGVYRTNKSGGEDVLRMLEWLRLQSLSEPEQRARNEELQACWKTLEASFERARFLERAPKTPQFWASIREFISNGGREGLLTSHEPLTRSGPSIIQIFQKMREQSAKSDAPTETKVLMKKLLTEIIEESQKPGPVRDRGLIRKKWKEAHPVLKEHKVLEEFESKPIKAKILSFLAGPK